MPKHSKKSVAKSQKKRSMAGIKANKGKAKRVIAFGTSSKSDKKKMNKIINKTTRRQKGNVRKTYRANKK